VASIYNRAMYLPEKRRNSDSVVAPIEGCLGRNRVALMPGNVDLRTALDKAAKLEVSHEYYVEEIERLRFEFGHKITVAACPGTDRRRGSACSHCSRAGYGSQFSLPAARRSGQ
jgi:hypothetical protein